ncbi:hypothetical protein C8Q70DRAFT_138314 [Cubamyces menziesii]|nr:hypothetical protein C8Q70DRAFT_138314 [Cubamyces menziesii]
MLYRLRPVPPPPLSALRTARIPASRSIWYSRLILIPVLTCTVPTVDRHSTTHRAAPIYKFDVRACLSASFRAFGRPSVITGSRITVQGHHASHQLRRPRLCYFFTIEVIQEQAINSNSTPTLVGRPLATLADLLRHTDRDLMVIVSASPSAHVRLLSANDKSQRAPSGLRTPRKETGQSVPSLLSSPTGLTRRSCIGRQALTRPHTHPSTIAGFRLNSDWTEIK